ncbi:hypothetical protein FHR72_004865 [Mycolicibacterium iranicum]|uniref:Uncharacterized protein n=1 Tax=Mycolicibacterium iranicum TaxID=912594 RepID=A0A839QCL3_MYCIR|nr:hypothetical protein [Mycolicibacterium iranicum]MBB2993357.1 hypothetical protein [Mycolicibacterium iranicum]
MQVKKFVVAAAVTAGLGTGMFLGAGQASADPKWWEPLPPGHVGQIVDVPPGHIGQWVGVPPGHWDKPWKWFN